jgi:hypothetical protein
MKALLRGPTCVTNGVAVAGVPETDAAGPSLVHGAVSGVPGGYYIHKERYHQTSPFDGKLYEAKTKRRYRENYHTCCID